MSFAQQLGRKSAHARQRYEIGKQLYQAETQRLLQLWVAEIKERFMAACEAEADKRKLSCTLCVGRPDHLTSRGVDGDLLQQQLQGLLAELGKMDMLLLLIFRLFVFTVSIPLNALNAMQK